MFRGHEMPPYGAGGAGGVGGVFGISLIRRRFFASLRMTTGSGMTEGSKMTTGSRVTTGEGDDYRGERTVEGPVILNEVKNLASRLHGQQRA